MFIVSSDRLGGNITVFFKARQKLKCRYNSYYSSLCAPKTVCIRFIRFPLAKVASGKTSIYVFCQNTLILHKVSATYSASAAGFAAFLVVFLAAGFFSSVFVSSLTSASASAFFAGAFFARFSLVSMSSNFSFMMELTM